MLLLRSIVSMFSTVTIALGASPILGQPYPTKPVRIVTSDTGGGADFVARLISPGLSGLLGQPVVIDNRGSAVMGEVVSKSPADGSVLLLANQVIWITPLLREVPYDPVKDFSPISAITNSPNIIVVHPSVPAKTIKELIAYAKTRPGMLNYAFNSPGGSSHLAMELLKALAGVDIVGVPYKSPAQELTDLLAGQVQMTAESVPVIVPHVKTGKLRALAVTTAEPSALAPGLPTVVAAGLPGYEIKSTYAMFAPARTPEAIITRLNQEIVRVISSSDVKDKLFDNGAEAVGSSPKEFANQIKSEMTTIGKVIKEAGIKTP